MKRYWRDTQEFQRILEILDDYWLTEPDEASVVVDIQLLHKNGEYQSKHIVWDNPNIKWPDTREFVTIYARELIDKLINGKFANTIDGHICKRADQLKEMRT